MISKRTFRTGFVVVTLVLSALLMNGYLTAGVLDRYENREAEVEPRNGTTVVTTSPRSTGDASIIAFAPNGSVQYYNETYDWYFDVDPVEGKPNVVEYVAVELVSENCDRRSRFLNKQPCSRNVVERLNLTTGETTRIYSYFTRPKDIGGWHDVDRINDSHLLVTGSTNDRIFVVNASSRIVEWQWDVQSAFDVSSGGKFPSDWTHVNDVTLLDDGRIMVSVRNQDQVVFLDRNGIISNWTLGSDDDYEILYEQHNPDYIPESRGGPAVVVADSHNNRIVEYQRTDSGTWEQTWSWTDLEMQWPRDGDRLPNGHTLVTDSNGNRVFEINEQGDIVWEVPVDTPYEAERLETGDESANGESAQRLDLQSREQSGNAAQNGGSSESSGSILTLTVEVAKRLLPAFVVNSLIFVLPAWVDFRELLMFLSLFGVLGVWAIAEFRWSAYALKVPISKRK